MKTLYTMVGMQYRGTKADVAAMKGGEALTLVREPLNDHDASAVAVWRDGKHLAYIKSTEAVALARGMDRNGQKQIGGVFRITADRWPQVEVDSR